MLNEQVTLALYHEIVASSEAPRGPELPMLTDTLLLGLGGFGGDSAIRAAAQCALRGSVPIVGTLDNAASPRVDPTLPDGRLMSTCLPPGSHQYLDTGDRRTALLDHPLLAARYSEDRLLRGHWVAGSGTQQGGHGGGAQPLMTLIDMDLQIRQVRTWLRGLLGRAAGTGLATGGVLADLLGRQEQGQSHPFVLVVAGGSGACGAGACIHLGYLIRQEAAALRLGRPTVWLLLAGPRSFTGLTGRTLVNYASTLQALEYYARRGIHWPGIDGEVLREQAAPYDRVWLMDDPRLPGDGTKVNPRELEDFSGRVAAAARAILQPGVRAAYLDHVANSESAASWPGFGTLQIGQGGFVPALLQPQLAAELAHRRATALVTNLAGL